MPIFRYPEPRLYRLHKMVYEMTRKTELKERFLKDPEKVMQDFGLSAEDREVVKRGDPVEMFEYGISPYTIFFLVWQIQGRIFQPPEKQVLYKAQK